MRTVTTVALSKRRAARARCREAIVEGAASTYKRASASLARIGPLGVVALALAGIAGCGRASAEADRPARQAMSSSPQSSSVPPKTPRVGPLGLAFGMSESELKTLVTLKPGDSPGLFSAETVPTPHSAFEGYQLTVGGAWGLCRLVAVGDDIPINSFGTQLKEKFKELEEEITQKYGPPSEQVDRLLSGSIWDEPNDWAMAISRKERYKYTTWKFDKERDDKVTTIELSARASSNRSGYAVLIYTSGKSDNCEAEAKKTRKSIL